jgi:membrane protease YdiL (CAAX protease family)
MVQNKKILIEAVFLYFVFFACAVFSSGRAEITITAKGELLSLLFFKLPLIVAILSIKIPGAERRGLQPTCKNLFLSAAAALAGLFLAAFLIMFVSNIILGTENTTRINIGNYPLIHIIIIVSSVSTAYLEELFFRFFLLKTFSNMPPPAAVTLSSVMFAACHIAQGVQGITNAFAAGIILCVIFLRLKSFYGIVIAHALFDIIVFETYL